MIYYLFIVPEDMEDLQLALDIDCKPSVADKVDAQSGDASWKAREDICVSGWNGRISRRQRDRHAAMDTRGC